jgi:4-azaleucine resistance transporter AzlC
MDSQENTPGKRGSGRFRASAAGVGLSILLGYFSIALAFGVSARAVGLDLPFAASFSVFVFAGASQFLAVTLLSQGVTVLPIIAATLILNSRHIVMSLALRDRITGEHIPRALLGFGITDEVFTAAATRGGQIEDRELLLMQVMAYSGWVAGTIVGFLAGTFLPEVVEQAMGIALYAMFVALIVPPVLSFPRYLVPALAAGGLNWILQASGTSVGLSLLIAIAVPALGFALVPGWTDEPAEAA